VLHQVTWRRGTKATSNTLASMTSRFIALRVRAANRDIPRADDGSLPAEWLLALTEQQFSRHYQLSDVIRSNVAKLGL